MKRSAVFRWISFGTVIALAVPVHAQLQGTLFTEPEERDYLDYLRQEFLRSRAEQGFDIEEVEIPEIPVDAAPVDTGPLEYDFGGLMTHRDGSHSVWLNGALMDEAQLPEGFDLVRNSGATSLRFSHEGFTYFLKPGQRVNLASGTVSERPANAQPAATVNPESFPPSVTPQEPELTDPAGVSVDSATDATTEALEQESVTVDPEDRSAAIAETISELTEQEREQLVDMLQRLQQEQDEEP